MGEASRERGRRENRSGTGMSGLGGEDMGLRWNENMAPAAVVVERQRIRFENFRFVRVEFVRSGCLIISFLLLAFISAF